METIFIFLGILFGIILRAWLTRDSDDDCLGWDAWYDPSCPEYWFLFDDDDDNHHDTWDNDTTY